MQPFVKAIPRSFAAWILISQLMLACASREPVPIPSLEEGEPVTPIRHLLVVPFYDMVRLFGPQTGVRGPFSEQVFVTGATDPLVTDFLTQDLIKLLLRRHPDLRMTLAESQVFDPRMHADAEPDSKRFSILRQAGRQRSADAVLVGFIYDYQDREGAALGVREPSRVAFELNLIGVASGRLLWHRQYQEVQKPLSENLLLLPKFLKRGGRWVPVREMAHDAMEQMLKTIPQTD